jgi:hypothetical protein
MGMSDAIDQRATVVARNGCCTNSSFSPFCTLILCPATEHSMKDEHIDAVSNGSHRGGEESEVGIWYSRQVISLGRKVEAVFGKCPAVNPKGSTA